MTVLCHLAMLFCHRAITTRRQDDGARFTSISYWSSIVAPDRQHTITTKRILKGETGILNSRSDALIIILSQCHNDRTLFKVNIVPSLALWRLPVYMCNKNELLQWRSFVHVITMHNTSCFFLFSLKEMVQDDTLIIPNNSLNMLRFRLELILKSTIENAFIVHVNKTQYFLQPNYSPKYVSLCVYHRIIYCKSYDLS